MSDPGWLPWIIVAVFAAAFCMPFVAWFLGILRSRKLKAFAASRGLRFVPHVYEPRSFGALWKSLMQRKDFAEVDLTGMLGDLKPFGRGESRKATNYIDGELERDLLDGFRLLLRDPLLALSEG